MANRKITVLNPSGYQELFQSGDNLLVDGSVNLQSNGLTGVPQPGVNLDAANKEYVDAGDDANSTLITSLDGRVTSVETQLGGLGTPNDSQVTITSSDGITVTGDSTFTLNQATDVTLNLAGPDLSNYLTKPSGDGDFLITENNGVISYTAFDSLDIDGGTYS